MTLMPAGVPTGATAAETQLLEAAQRVGRQGAAHNAGRVALVLHLSALRYPAPRPHHRRIARAMLQDTAQRHAGQVFVLRNGDFALLCRDSGLHDPGARETVWREGSAGRRRDEGSGRTVPRSADAAGPRAGPAATRRESGAPFGSARSHAASLAGGPSALGEALARLLRVDAADPDRLVSVWPLDRAHDRLLAYAIARTEERLADPGAMEEDPVAPPGVVDEIGALIGHARIHDLMQRQTAVVLLAPEARGGPDAYEPASATGAGGAMRPIYREVTFSIAALEARVALGGQASADPFLFRHLAAQLDRRMLDVVREELGRGGPLDIGIGSRGAPPLHLNLTLGAVLSPSFKAFAATCRAAGTTAGVEMSLIEVCADTASFAAARAAVTQAGMALVIDGVSHLALLLAAPWTLEPDLLKLDWSPRLVDLGHADRADMGAAIAAVGAHRVVLQRAETEAALRWGLANGIRRFQGRHVDAMLGASRIMGCAHSAGCTLRQCIERAGATSPGARAGCANPALLDAGVPPRAKPTSAAAARSPVPRAAPAPPRTPAPRPVTVPDAQTFSNAPIVPNGVDGSATPRAAARAGAPASSP